MDVLKRLKNIMNEKGISEYKLSKLSNVPQSTINSMFHKYNNPTIYTLESLCKGLDITMSEFFRQDKDSIEVTNDTKLMILLQEWNQLNMSQNNALLNLLQSFHKTEQ